MPMLNGLSVHVYAMHMLSIYGKYSILCLFKILSMAAAYAALYTVVYTKYSCSICMAYVQYMLSITIYYNTVYLI